MARVIEKMDIRTMQTVYTQISRHVWKWRLIGPTLFAIVTDPSLNI